MPGNHTWFAFPLKTVHVQLVVTQAYENVAKRVERLKGAQGKQRGVGSIVPSSAVATAFGFRTTVLPFPFRTVRRRSPPPSLPLLVLSFPSRSEQLVRPLVRPPPSLHRPWDVRGAAPRSHFDYFIGDFEPNFERLACNFSSRKNHDKAKQGRQNKCPKRPSQVDLRPY